MVCSRLRPSVLSFLPLSSKCESWTGYFFVEAILGAQSLDETKPSFTTSHLPGKKNQFLSPMSEYLYKAEEEITPAQLAFLRKEKEKIEAEERAAADRVTEWTVTCAKRGSPGFVGRNGQLFVDLEETRKWEKALAKRENSNKLRKEYEGVVERLWRRDGGRRGSVGGIFSAVPRMKKGGAGEKGSLEKPRIYTGGRDSSTFVSAVEDERDTDGVRRVFGRLKKRFTV